MLTKQSSKPLLSLITIVYNGESFISETIESVLNQKDSRCEYIIIDGGSNDSTLEVINQYKESIDLIISEKDDGIYDALNKGVKLSSGYIIGFIHCGDYLNKNALNNVLDTFKKNNADIVYGDINELDDNKIRRNHADHSQLKEKMSIFHPATFIKRDIYQKYGIYSLKYKIASDYELLLEFYIQGKLFVHIKEPIVTFRLGGISSTNYKLRINENISIRYNKLGLFSAVKYIIITGVPSYLLNIRKNMKSALKFN